MNERHQSHQVPDVQGVRGGINAAIGRQSSRFQSLFQTGFTIKKSENSFLGTLNLVELLMRPRNRNSAITDGSF